ncbi:MAG: hypothetical protein J0M09_10175 [Xanthomonadales bacterium]|nr:hypothetical protein [Xanthomonadales bacterium]
MIVCADELLLVGFVEQCRTHRSMRIGAFAHDLVGIEILVVRPDAGDATGFAFLCGDFQHGQVAGAFGGERTSADALFGVWCRYDGNAFIGEVLPKLSFEWAVLDLLANSLGDGEIALLCACNFTIFIQQIRATSLVGINEAVGISQKISVAHKDVFRN